MIRETKVEGQSESLAERVSRRLGNDGDLSTRQAAATIRLAIGKVPQIWKDGHVSLGALWGLYSQYPYMPRLRDRRVLDEGIVDLPMIWQTDAFALATGYDEAAGRYIGLWTPEDKERRSRRHRLAPARPPRRRRQAARGRGAGADRRPGPDRARRPGPDPSPTPPEVDIVFPNAKTRFYGVKTLNSDKIALDFKNIADEVIAHLRADDEHQR